MARKPRRPGKGVFGAPKLPVATSYVMPVRRRALIGLGVVAGLVLLAYAMVDRYSGGSFISGGPLSSAHAVLETDCASCHLGFAAPADESCATCHEKYGDELGTYSFASHYLYRSNDFQRVVASEHEMPCAACHIEHQGRTADISAVVDARCLTCHQRGSFVDGHPEFFFAESPEGDDDALSFGHGFHVNEMMQEQGWADVEKACLACHEPKADGKTFEAIEFDRHCEACHLTAGTATPRLTVAPNDDPTADGIGVETLSTIRASARPGIDWAFYTDPSEFREAGSSVAKTTIYHEDPWILHNLRRMRRLLYEDAGLADLLATTPEVAEGDQRRLYEEAIEALREQIKGLRGTANDPLQDQLATLEGLLARAEEMLADPFAAIDETEFLLALGEPRDLPTEVVAEAELLISELTEPCSGCHFVENATIVRVDGDQRTLKRAEFDHKAHVIQRRCLDCHNQIPIFEVLEGADPDPVLDHSGIHNLPTIDSCRECHNPKVTVSSCVSCHVFHPGREDRNNLLRYVEPEDLAKWAEATSQDGGSTLSGPTAAESSAPEAGDVERGEQSTL